MIKTIYSLISLFFISLCIQAQEIEIPSIRPLISFDIGIVGNSMDNITSKIVDYTGANQSPDASLRMGINVGVFIGERHKLALSYNSSLNSRYETITQTDYSSTGFWYQYKVLKNNPLFIQIGFTETIANLYVSNKNASPIVKDGTWDDYLNDNSSYTVAHFEQWTDGLHLALSYNFFENNLLSISGQLGYLWNFNYGSWQYMYDNLDRLGNTNLPKDNLNGLFLKVNMELNFLNTQN